MVILSGIEFLAFWICLREVEYGSHKVKISSIFTLLCPLHAQFKAAICVEITCVFCCGSLLLGKLRRSISVLKLK